MAMTQGEAQAVMNVLRWSLDLWERPVWRVRSPEKAKVDALWLVDRAHNVLGAGLTTDDVVTAWPEQEPGEAAAALAAIRQLLDEWDAGEAFPHDALTAIRDRIGPKGDPCTP